MGARPTAANAEAEHMALSEQQQPVSTSRRNNKRACLVCLRCHEKKIKCNLQPQSAQTSGQALCPCQNCVTTNSLCQVRPSRRGNGKRQPRSSNTTAQPNQAAVLTGTDLSVQTSQRHGQSASATNHYRPSLGQDATLDLSDHNLYTADLHQGGNGTTENRPMRSEGPLMTPSSSASQQPQQASFFGETGYMQMFSRDSGCDEHISPAQMPVESGNVVDAIPPALQDSYLDTFFEYGYVWCPVLDKKSLQFSEVADSPLLAHALALCGNQIKPPLMLHSESLTHYNRAKALFYGAQDSSQIVRIAALMLFYWWSAGPPNIVSMDTNWWWTGVAIRLAQEIGLHREPQPGQSMGPGETPGLRRRIWWGLFARERISALSQGRPCIIDPDYCDVRMLTREDWPDPNDPRAEIFINFIQLCEIMGRIGKRMFRRADGLESPVSPAQDLTLWVQSLPVHLRPSFEASRTVTFNRDVHGLHLVYLSTVTLLHLSKSDEPLPRASVAAIAAASCTARIFRDYLARGSVRFLAGQAGWYITLAILALLHARTIHRLAVHADADIRTLRDALQQMALLWHAAKMFSMGFDRILGPGGKNKDSNSNKNARDNIPDGNSSFTFVTHNRINPNTTNTNHNDNLTLPQQHQQWKQQPTHDQGGQGPQIHSQSSLRDNLMSNTNQNIGLGTGTSLDWMGYFPYVTAQTSPLIAELLTATANNDDTNMDELPFGSDLDWSADMTAQLHEFFVRPDEINLDAFNF